MVTITNQTGTEAVDGIVLDNSYLHMRIAGSYPTRYAVCQVLAIRGSNHYEVGPILYEHCEDLEALS